MVHPRLVKTYRFVTLHVLHHLAYTAHLDLYKRFWSVMPNAGTRVPPAPRIDMPGIQTTAQSLRTWYKRPCKQYSPLGLLFLHSFSHHRHWQLVPWTSSSLHRPACTRTNILRGARPTAMTGPPRPNSVHSRRFLSFILLLNLPRAF